MDAVLTVDLERVIQENFLGVNGTYHGFTFMPEQESKGMTGADRAREFERVARMDLKIARTWYRPDWACAECLGSGYDWESRKMQAFYRWLEAMRERNVDVALQAGWWFTGDTYYGYRQPDPVNDIPRYTTWVSESLRQMIEVRGFDHIRYLFLLTEPTSYASGIVPSGFTQWSYYARMMRALHERLTQDGRRGLVKLVGPNNTHGGMHLVEAVKDLDDVLDIYSGHDYNKADYAEWFSMCQAMQSVAQPTGKPLWLDEFGKQDEAYRQTADYGNYLAQAAAASINAGNQASFLWLLFDQQYVAVSPTSEQDTTNADSFYHGIHRWGTCKWPHDTVENPTYPYPHWYAFSLLSRYLGGRRGTRVFAVQSSAQVYGAATAPNGEEVSVLVINLQEEAQAVRVEIQPGLGRTLYRYLYDPQEITPEEDARLIGCSKVLEHVQEGFEDLLPPRAVAVYSTMGE